MRCRAASPKADINQSNAPPTRNGPWARDLKPQTRVISDTLAPIESQKFTGKDISSYLVHFDLGKHFLSGFGHVSTLYSVRWIKILNPNLFATPDVLVDEGCEFCSFLV